MYHHLLRYLSLALVAAAVALPAAASAQTKSMPRQENNEGQVMVAVTPLVLSKTADAWRFEVQLTTHVAPITEDMAVVATLSDGKGHNEQPSAWEGDPPGGHHRKGVLVFKPISPMPGSITLHIRQVGAVPERSFTWNMGVP